MNRSVIFVGIMVAVFGIGHEALAKKNSPRRTRQEEGEQQNGGEIVVELHVVK